MQTHSLSPALRAPVSLQAQGEPIQTHLVCRGFLIKTSVISKGDKTPENCSAVQLDSPLYPQGDFSPGTRCHAIMRGDSL